MPTLCHELPTTLTHPVEGDRTAEFVPGDGWTIRGAVIVTQGKATSVYALDEDTSEPFPGRKWLLRKQDSRGAVYGVSLDPAGWRCTCDGWQCHRGAFRCLHVDAVQVLHDAGELDPAAEGSGLWFQDEMAA